MDNSLIPSKYLNQTDSEEIANGISHGVGLILSIVGLILLIIFSSSTGDFVKILSMIIYGLSLIILFLMSTLSHSLKKPRAKKFFQIMDYIAIYILIAGSYTPVLLVALNTNESWIIFLINWTIVVFGIIYKIFFIGKQEIVSNILYLGMGWTGILIANQLIEKLPIAFGILCLIGGICYTFGLIFYLWYKLNFNHLIWHLFVLAGSIFIYFAILLYIAI